MVRYIKHADSEAGWTEWFKPRQSPEIGHYRMGCCDCGLVHELDFKVSDNGAVWLRARRNERATAAKRRHRKTG